MNQQAQQDRQRLQQIRASGGDDQAFGRNGLDLRSAEWNVERPAPMAVERPQQTPLSTVLSAAMLALGKAVTGLALRDPVEEAKAFNRVALGLSAVYAFSTAGLVAVVLVALPMLTNGDAFRLSVVAIWTMLAGLVVFLWTWSRAYRQHLDRTAGGILKTSADEMFDVFSRLADHELRDRGE